MAIFRLEKNKLLPVSSKKFDLEKDIQKITEENLESLFGVKFVSGSLTHEFSIGVAEQDFYIDTLAFDESQKSVVIIEYKKDKSFSVIDQGFAYLSAVLNHKADLILELNERLNKNFRKDGIDWEATRVIFISPEFTNYQKNAINFKDLPIYLYEVNLYENGLIEYDPIKPYRTTESINKITKDKTIQSVSKEIKVYSVEDHLLKANASIRELFGKLQTKIIELDERIQEKPVSWYIGYKIRYHNFCSLSVYKEKLRVYTRVDKITDAKKIFKKVPAKWAWGKTTIWYTDISKEDAIDYVMSIVRQGYESAPDK